MAELRRRGHEVVVMPNAIGRECGTYAASDAARLSDLREALIDETVDVILCGRGGYGCVHLMSEELEQLVRENPKWLLGFSDVSALHALWMRAGAPSLHCSMAKQLALSDPAIQTAATRALLEKELAGTGAPEASLAARCECVGYMFDILEGRSVEYSEERDDLKAPRAGMDGADAGRAQHPLNLPGEASGRIIGGNLAVLNGLASTRWDLLSPENVKGNLLFLEDVGEKIYQVERMLKRLQMAGTLDAASGLLFGRFTDYKPDRNFHTMEEMISTRLKEWGIRKPTAYHFPIGHIQRNLPIPEGVYATLSVSPSHTLLQFLIPNS